MQSTDQCKIVSQSPSGLVLPWREIYFLTVLEAKSKIKEPANSAHVKTLFPVCRQPPSHCVLMWLRKQTLISLFFLWSHHVAYGILVPQPGTKPGPLAMKVESPNYWPTREPPGISLFFLIKTLILLWGPHPQVSSVQSLSCVLVFETP